MHGGNVKNLFRLGQAARRLGHSGADTVAGIHQAEKYLGSGVIGDDVGRAAALNCADVQRARAQTGSLGMGMRRMRSSASSSFSIADSPKCG